MRHPSTVKRVAGMVPRPQTHKGAQAVRRSFRMLIHAFKNSIRFRRASKTQDGPGAVFLSLHRAAQAGRASLQEDLDLIHSFFRAITGKKTDTPPPLRLPGQTIKDPTPHTRVLMLALLRPRKTLKTLIGRLLDSLRYCAAHAREVTVIFFVILLSLELSLHLSSIAGWSLLQWTQAQHIATRRVALFLGDAFTSGEFSTRAVRSYTDYLAPFLSKQQRNTRWKIVNFSAQHATADTILHVLPALITQERPSVAYIMIGADDLLDEESKVSLKLENQSTNYLARADFFMTGALVRRWYNTPSLSTVLDFFTHPPSYLQRYVWPANSGHRISREIQSLLKASKPVPDFPDQQTWHYMGKRVVRNADEWILSDSMRFRCHSSKGYCTSTTSNDAWLWELDGEKLVLNGITPGDSVVLTQERAVSDPKALSAQHLLKSGWVHLKILSLERAKTFFKESMDFAPEEPLAHAGLAEVAYLLGDYRTLDHEVRWLHQKQQKEPNLVTARALIHTYPFSHSAKETLDLAIQLLNKYPQNPWIWHVAAKSFLQSGEIDYADRSIRKAIALVPDEMKALRASLLRTLAEIVVHNNTQEAMRSVVEAFFLDGDYERTQESFQNGYKAYNRSLLNEALNDRKAPEDLKAELKRTFAWAIESPEATRILNLKERLKAAVELCLQYGVHPVFVTYPLRQGHVSDLQRLIAQETGAAWMNLNGSFELILQKENQNRDILRYGTLTDEGSRKIAELIAADMATRFAVL